MKRILSILLALCLLWGALPTALAADSEGTQTVTLTVPTDVTVVLYVDYGASGDTVPVSTSYNTGNNKVLIYNVGNGSYSFKLTGTGYYKYTKNFYVLNNSPSFRIDPGKKTGKGFESASAIERTDGAQKNLLASETTSWPGYEHIFSTPVFTSDLGNHEFTSQTAMMGYLRELETPVATPTSIPSAKRPPTATTFPCWCSPPPT